MYKEALCGVTTLKTSALGMQQASINASASIKRLTALDPVSHLNQRLSNND
jgi:hypothetical protein